MPKTWTKKKEMKVGDFLRKFNIAKLTPETSLKIRLDKSLFSRRNGKNNPSNPYCCENTGHKKTITGKYTNI